uniref:Uncharacterized protein n=1 Tax=Anopheles quadriannulatus TaxID=34691 RepID=A0A182XLD1_ANOQN
MWAMALQVFYPSTTVLPSLKLSWTLIWQVAIWCGVSSTNTQLTEQMCDMRCDKHSGKETLNAIHFGASYGYIVMIKTERFRCDETMFDVS